MSELEKKDHTAEDLPIYVRCLTLRDIDPCTELEAQGFGPEERASKEKFIYRLTACPELSVGLFTSTVAKSEGEPRKEILLGHCIATKTLAQFPTERSMDIPPTFRARVLESREPTREEIEKEKKAAEENDNYGHDERGKVVGLHSLVVHPDFQKRGYGKLLVKEFVARVKQPGYSTRVALLARPDLVEFYKTLFFVDDGESACEHGGQKWRNMYRDISF